MAILSLLLIFLWQGAPTMAATNTERVGNGPALVNPYGIVITDNNDAYVIDRGSSSVFLVDLTSGDRTVISGPDRGVGPVTTEMRGVDIEPSLDSLLVADSNLKAVIRINIMSGERTVVSDATRGTGPNIDVPRGVAVDSTGNVFVTDFSLDAVVEVDPTTGNRRVISGLTSGGNVTVGTGLDLKQPHGIHASANGYLYVTDVGWPAVIEINSTTGNRRLVSGTGPGPNVGTGPELSSLRGLTSQGPGTLIVVDFKENEVISIDISDGIRRRISGPGVGSGVDLGLPVDAALTTSAQIVVCDFTPPSVIAVDPLTGDRSVVTSSPKIGLQTPLYVAVLPSGRIVASDTGRRAIWLVDEKTGDRAILSAADKRGDGDAFTLPLQLIVLDDGDLVVVDDGTDAVVRVDFSTGNRTIISGKGVGTGREFVSPRGLLQKSDGNLVVFDTGLTALINVDMKTGNRVVLSDASQGTGPLMHNVNSIVVLDDGTIVVGDAQSKLLTVNPTNGNRQAIPVQENHVAITEPWGLAVSPTGSVYVTYYQGAEAAIASVNPDDGMAFLVSSVSSTIAKRIGGGADMRSPAGCGVEQSGSIVVSDFYYGTVLRIDAVEGDRSVVTSATVGNTVDLDVLLSESSGSSNIYQSAFGLALVVVTLFLLF